MFFKVLIFYGMSLVLYVGIVGFYEIFNLTVDNLCCFYVQVEYSVLTVLF